HWTGTERTSLPFSHESNHLRRADDVGAAGALQQAAGKPPRAPSDGIPLRNERSADLLSSSDGHLGAADVGLGLRGYEGARVPPRVGRRHATRDWRISGPEPGMGESPALASTRYFCIAEWSKYRLSTRCGRRRPIGGRRPMSPCV